VLTPPIPLFLPLLVAGILLALRGLPRWIATGLSILTSLFVAGVAVSLAGYTRDEPIIVYHFGPSVPGFSLVIDTASAILVLIAAVMTAAALCFSSRYFENTGARYDSLLLIFLAGASGFSLTGDLLSMMFFSAMMSGAAYFLSRYRSDEQDALGLRNFLVTDIAGLTLMLAGVMLLYSRAGSFNFAQIGRALDAHSDTLVALAFALLVCGFFVKAAIAPFHYWLPGANAVAPAPVSALMSGLMVELGLYAVVRTYWTMFSGPFGSHEHEVRNLLGAFGALTAVVGAAMCYAQRDLKRLLSFATISHMGILLLGVALLSRQALAGVTIYVMGHATIKGGLFLCSGIVLYRTATLDEIELGARHRCLPWISGLLIAGAAGLAGAPPFGTFWGEMMIGGAAHALRAIWIEVIAFLAGAATAGAIFRFAARACFAWGPKAEPRISDRKVAQLGHSSTPAAMYIPAASLILLGLLSGFAPRLTGAAEAVAIHIEDREAYAQRVLDQLTPYPPTVGDQPALPGDYTRGLLTLTAAIVLAGTTLWSRSVRRVAGLRSFVRVLRAAHGGLVMHSLTWLIVGAAAFGAAAVVWLRTS
jgi:multicomponent Na+:H+ antiporter subunit D